MKRLSLLAGCAILVLIWFGPLLSVWRSSFASHMLAHMGVVAVASPLIAFGVTWPSAFRLGRIAYSLPILASLLELIIVWTWHAPLLRAFAETSLPGAVIEQASFLLVGLFLWGSCIGAVSSDVSLQRAAGILGLLFTSMHMTLLGALLALSSRPLYGAGQVTCFGLSLDAQQDQELGGVLMLLIGGVIYLAGGLTLLAKLLLERPALSRTVR
jgi:putative membrane protein